jgi:hypothetical protein
MDKFTKIKFENLPAVDKVLFNKGNATVYFADGSEPVTVTQEQYYGILKHGVAQYLSNINNMEHKNEE